MHNPPPLGARSAQVAGRPAVGVRGPGPAGALGACLPARRRARAAAPPALHACPRPTNLKTNCAPETFFPPKFASTR